MERILHHSAFIEEEWRTKGREREEGMEGEERELDEYVLIMSARPLIFHIKDMWNFCFD